MQRGLAYYDTERDLEQAILRALDCPVCGGGGFSGRGSGYDAVCAECGGQKQSPWGAAQRLRMSGYVCSTRTGYVASLVAGGLVGVAAGIMSMVGYVLVMGGIP